jgi:hypothetical protein
MLPYAFESPQSDRTSHYVVFVSKHQLGHRIMKDMMYNLSSDEGEVRRFWYAPTRKGQLSFLLDIDNPYSLPALKNLLMQSCAGKSLSVLTIYDTYTIDTPYTFRNVQDAILELEKEGRVTVDPPAAKRQKRQGRPTLAKDKVVTFPP